MANTNNIILDVKIKGERDIQDLSKILEKSSSSGKELQKTLDSLRQSMMSTQSACKELTSGTAAYATALDKATTAANNFKTANAQVAASFGAVYSTNVGEQLASQFSATNGVLTIMGQDIEGVNKRLLELNNIAQMNVATQGAVSAKAGYESLRGSVQGATAAVSNLNSTSVTGLNAQQQSVLDLALSYSKLSEKEIEALDPSKAASYEKAVEGVDNELAKLATDMDRATSLSNKFPGVDLLKTQAEQARTAYSNLVAQIVLSGNAIEHNSESSEEAIAITNRLNEEFARTGQIASLNNKIINSTSENTSKSLGNTSKKFNGLSMSIQQVARELPSLAMGPQMFFLAISNNLPILSDQIKIARMENEALNASGQKGVPVWKQVAGSIFSWQTAMVVGITLLITYGKQLGDLISGLFSTEAALIKVTTAQEAFNTARLKGDENAQKEITNLKILYGAATDVSRSLTERKTAVTELQKLYPSYFKNMSSETVMTGGAASMYLKLTNAILESARAKVKADQISKISSEQWENEMKRAGVLMQIEEQRSLLQQRIRERSKIFADTEAAGASQERARLRKEANLDVKSAQNGLASLIRTYDSYTTAINSSRRSQELLTKSIKVSDLVVKPGDETKVPGDKSFKSTPDKKFVNPSVPTKVDYAGVQAPGMEEIKKFDEYYNERNAVIASNNSNLSTLYKDWQSLTIDNNLKIEEARRQDIQNAKDFYGEQLKQAIRNRDEVYPVTKKRFDDNEALYKKSIDDLNALYSEEARLKDESLKAEDKYNEDMSKAKTNSSKKNIEDAYKIQKEGLDKSIDLNKQAIKSSKDEADSYKSSREALLKQLESLKNTPDEVEALQAKLADLDGQFANSIKNTAGLFSESIQNKLEIAGKAFDAVGGLTSGIADLYKAEAQEVDNSYDAEEDRINSMNVTDEERTELLKQNEQARYEEKKKLFEKQKKWEEATAWINFASGVVSIWKGSFEELGPIAGPIIAGVETAALLATTLANVKSIRAQKIDAPSSSASSSTGGATANVFAALNPTESALKSKEENLANIQSSYANEQVTVVKVSDINKVQNNVSVRDNNTNY